MLSTAQANQLIPGVYQAKQCTSMRRSSSTSSGFTQAIIVGSLPQSYGLYKCAPTWTQVHVMNKNAMRTCSSNEMVHPRGNPIMLVATNCPRLCQTSSCCKLHFVGNRSDITTSAAVCTSETASPDPCCMGTHTSVDSEHERKNTTMFPMVVKLFFVRYPLPSRCSICT